MLQTKHGLSGLEVAAKASKFLGTDHKNGARARGIESLVHRRRGSGAVGEPVDHEAQKHDLMQCNHVIILAHNNPDQTNPTTAGKRATGVEWIKPQTSWERQSSEGTRCRRPPRAWPSSTRRDKNSLPNVCAAPHIPRKT